MVNIEELEDIINLVLLDGLINDLDQLGELTVREGAGLVLIEVLEDALHVHLVRIDDVLEL